MGIPNPTWSFVLGQLALTWTWTWTYMLKQLEVKQGLAFMFVSQCKKLQMGTKLVDLMSQKNWWGVWIALYVFLMGKVIPLSILQ